MKNRIKIEKKITAYIHGELSKRAAKKLEEQLEKDTSLQAELEDQRATLELVGSKLQHLSVPAALSIPQETSKSLPVLWPSFSDIWFNKKVRIGLLATASCCLLVLFSQLIVMPGSVINHRDGCRFSASSRESTFSSVPSCKMPLKRVRVPSSSEFKNEAVPRKRLVVAQNAKGIQPEMGFPDLPTGGSGMSGGVERNSPPTKPRSSSKRSLPEITGCKSGRKTFSGSLRSSPSVSYRRVVCAKSRSFGNISEAKRYSTLAENDYKEVMKNPLSTFSIDVDTASYANVRKFLNRNQMPPSGAVRIEEMINYFNYNYPQPQEGNPFSITIEAGQCPWNREHQLVLIGLQGKKIETENLPPNNLVFLLDVSGSMSSPDKLPLLKSAMRLLVKNLRSQDRVSIVVYAGAAGLVLNPTADKGTILRAINNLSAGGSTAGGAGIKLAYRVAQETFIKEGNNRVILATDGDFNVGVQSEKALVKLIEQKRKSGIFLSVLGFGSGNFQDAKMEKLADKGNGNFSYIDSILEAKKVLVTEMAGTLFTIAKDVKIQIEFNPQQVKSYRLVGYENRILAKEDFADDTKDAGELGAGHTVTALYELIPANDAVPQEMQGDLKYQTRKVVKSDELMNVKLRYKNPNASVSKLIVKGIKTSSIQKERYPENLGFACSVSEFGMLLRHSKYAGNANFQQVIQRAKIFKGSDLDGYRAEFIHLVEKAQLISQRR